MQMMIVAVIVLLAIASMFRRAAPARVWQMQARLAFAIERGAARDSVRARIGRRLRPHVTAAVGGCAPGGCSSCNGCS